MTIWARYQERTGHSYKMKERDNLVGLSKDRGQTENGGCEALTAVLTVPYSGFYRRIIRSNILLLSSRLKSKASTQNQDVKLSHLILLVSFL
jgi:hypothetical protein